MNITEKVKNEVKRILKPYTTQPELLKAWEEVDAAKKTAFGTMARYFGNACFSFEAGKTPSGGKYFTEWEVEDLFGFPYTSTGEFAAIWNTNTQAKLNINFIPSLYFKAIAAAARPSAVRKFKKFDFIFIFSDCDGQFYYFSEMELLSILENLKRLNRAANLAEFVQNINECMPKVENVLTKYNGKKLGEKTREKIREELRDIGAEPSCRLSIYFNYYASQIEFLTSYNQYKRYIYINYYDEKTNTIKFENGARLSRFEEFDPVAALSRLDTQAAKVKEAAAALLPVIEEYNDAAKLLDVEKISQYGADLYTLGKYGVKNY